MGHHYVKPIRGKHYIHHKKSTFHLDSSIKITVRRLKLIQKLDSIISLIVVTAYLISTSMFLCADLKLTPIVVNAYLKSTLIGVSTYLKSPPIFVSTFEVHFDSCERLIEVPSDSCERLLEIHSDRREHLLEIPSNFCDCLRETLIGVTLT
jgi:hypothetical protein